MLLGGLLPIAAGFATTAFPHSHVKGTWSYPLTVQVFVGLAAVLALAHLLVAVGYDSIGDRSAGGAARSFAQLAALGTLLAAACEVASGVLAKAPRRSEPVDQLNTAYAVATALVLIGTLGAGVALRRAWKRVSIPLVVNGLFIAAALAPAFAVSVMKGDDGPRIAALTGWSMLYVWLGIAMAKGGRR